jgi:ATP:ADP antiporter, AAA family
VKARLEQLIQIRPAEVAAVGWSWLFFFSVLTAYYVLRPIRDDMGVAGGVQNLAWLFTGTLTGMAIANPVFGFVAGRLPRRRLVTVTYRFFASHLLVFFAVLHLGSPGSMVWAGRVFFVWAAVFTMFANSIFWSVMADAFSTSQGKRLFGFIGAGGTIGAITGAGLTSSLVGIIGAANLLLVSAALLEVSAFAARQVFRTAARADDEPAQAATADVALGGRPWDGLTRTLGQPYLRGIAIHLLLFTTLTTFLYFQQATIVDAAFTNRVERTRFFANVDLLVNILALLTQSLATGHLVRILGLTAALSYLPAMSLIGFIALGTAPTVTVLMAFQVLRRAGEFSIAKPAREVLFTVVPRADRYKAKNFIDTFVYRTGDQLSAWGYAALVAMGLSVTGTSAVGAAGAVVSIGVACWLGSRHTREGGSTQGLGRPAFVPTLPQAASAEIGSASNP